MVIAPRLNVVDSSAWLAYLADEAAATQFAEAIEDTDNLVVPAICILEVFKIVARQRGETHAMQAATAMLQGAVVDLDATLALAAARLGIERKLPLADSVVYATAQRTGAILWTQDADFTGLPDVRYIPKSPR
jgi:toxin FitB